MRRRNQRHRVKALEQGLRSFDEIGKLTPEQEAKRDKMKAELAALQSIEKAFALIQTEGEA